MRKMPPGTSVNTWAGRKLAKTWFSGSTEEKDTKEGIKTTHKIMEDKVIKSTKTDVLMQMFVTGWWLISFSSPRVHSTVQLFSSSHISPIPHVKEIDKAILHVVFVCHYACLASANLLQIVKPILILCFFFYLNDSKQ